MSEILPTASLPTHYLHVVEVPLDMSTQFCEQVTAMGGNMIGSLWRTSDTQEGCCLCQLLPTTNDVDRLQSTIQIWGSHRAAIHSFGSPSVLEALDHLTEMIITGPAHSRVFTAVLQTPCGLVGISEARQKKKAIDDALGAILRLHCERFSPPADSNASPST